ncbi:hypothetical protein Dimus_028529 [Dionaea muscipula]
MDMESESERLASCLPSYLQLDKESKLNLPSTPTRTATVAELDALEMDMESESERLASCLPSYLQLDKESKLNLPSTPTRTATVAGGRTNARMKLVLKLNIRDDKDKQKAIKSVSSFSEISDPRVVFK